MMKQWTWIVLLTTYAAAIGYVSHQPLSLGEAPFPHFDKLLHLAEFGLFMLLAWHATGRRLAIAWLLTLAFAGSDELHQALIPARDASLLDFVADFFGASVMAGLIHIRHLLWRFFSTRILDR
jgi:VanZ family protein